MDRLVRWHLDDQICYAYHAKACRSSGMHGHHHFLLTLITEGSGTQTLNGKELPFQPNDMFLLSPADFHKNTLPEGQTFSYYGVKFAYALLDARLSEVCALDELPIHLHLSSRTAQLAQSIFAQLVDECHHGQARLANRAYMQMLVEQLIILALREMKPDSQVRPDAFVNRALGYLYSNFTQPVTVSDAAQYVGYSTNYFNTCFQHHMGVPFREYLGNMRLNYARNLLVSSEISATEVAYESGFTSLSYFSRCFQQEYHLSPRAYRKRYQGTREATK